MREQYSDYILEALKTLGGSARIWEVSKQVWESHLKNSLTDNNPEFYTWQYDIRWAAQLLRDENKISSNPRGYWTIVD